MSFRQGALRYYTPPKQVGNVFRGVCPFVKRGKVHPVQVLYGRVGPVLVRPKGYRDQI